MEPNLKKKYVKPPPPRYRCLQPLRGQALHQLQGLHAAVPAIRQGQDGCMEAAQVHGDALQRHGIQQGQRLLPLAAELIGADGGAADDHIWLEHSGPHASEKSVAIWLGVPERKGFRAQDLWFEVLTVDPYLHGCWCINPSSLKDQRGASTAIGEETRSYALDLRIPDGIISSW